MALLRRTLILAILALISAAATSPENPSKKDDGEVASLKWSVYNIAALGTLVLVTSAGFAALVSLFLPLFIYKFCYLFGFCQDTLDIFNDFVVPRRVTKRSVEYLEPMMTTLVKAYETYADSDLKKKSRKPRF